MKKILTSIFLALLVVGIITSRALASTPELGGGHSDVTLADSPGLSPWHNLWDFADLAWSPDANGWAPNQGDARPYVFSNSGYAIIYNMELSEGEVEKKMVITGSVPREIIPVDENGEVYEDAEVKLYVRKREIRDGVTPDPYWTMVQGSKCNVDIARRKVSCEFPFKLTDLLHPVELHVGQNEPYQRQAHSPGLLLSKAMEAEDVLASLLCLFDRDCDNDGVPNLRDNCMLRPNPDQLNQDRDGRGDACDPDQDGDGWINIVDNCEKAYNPAQADDDRDTLEYCREPNPDPDGDGLRGISDRCPYEAETYIDGNPSDGNNDGCPRPGNEDGNNGDGDADNDDVADGQDNCPETANSEQTDIDNDGLGDACDDDNDNDGIPDANDNCRLVTNPGQADMDDDRIGDLCDTDLDGDGVDNDDDNCPLVHNPDQRNADNDGQGDVCDPSPDLPNDVVTVGNVVTYGSLGNAVTPGIQNTQIHPMSVRFGAGDGRSDSSDPKPDPNTNDRDGDLIPDKSITTGYATVGADAGGACSLGGTAAANPVAFLLLGLALMPMAIRRKKK